MEIRLKSSDRIFLNDTILQKVRAKFDERSEDDYSISRLHEDLSKYFEDEKHKLPMGLISALEKEFPGESAVEHACSSKTRKHNHGAAELLRDLLCFYAFGKNWEVTLQELGIDLNEEILWSKKLKEELKVEPENVVITRIGEVNANVLEILSRIDAPKVRDPDFADAVQKYNEASELGMLVNKEIAASRVIKKLSDQIKERDVVRSYILSELINTLTIQNKYAEVVDLAGSIAEWKQYITHTSYGIANAYYQLRNFDEALLHIQKTLDVFPYDIHAICMKAMCYREKNNLSEARTIIRKALEAKAKHLVYNSELHLNKETFEVQHVYAPANQESISSLYKTLALVGDQTDTIEILKYAELPEAQEDLHIQMYKAYKTVPPDLPLVIEISERLLQKENYNIEDLVAHINILTIIFTPSEEVLKYFKILADKNRSMAKEMFLTSPYFERYRNNSDFTALIE